MPCADYVVLHVGIPLTRDDSVARGFEFFEMELKRSDLPPGCLQLHETPDTTPEFEGRDFELLACRLEDVNGAGAAWQPDESVHDAWKMRDELFALEYDIFAMRRFLTRWGLWSYQPQFEMGSLRMHPFALMLPYQLWSLRQSLTKAAAGSPRAWLSTATPLSFKETDKRPYFMVERSYCEDAIKATITIDHLSNVKFGLCKRHDCRKMFKRTTAQKRLYCSPECAHLANVRKLRAFKSKGKKNATRKN